MEFNLGAGESAAISVAREKKDTLLLDDAQAIKAAKVYGLEMMRTTTVLFLAAHAKMLNHTKLINSINALIAEGYYIRPAEYAGLLSRIREKM